MKLYLLIPVALVALLIAASGIAAVSRGWILPVNRRTVHRPRLHGWGQLTIAVALCWQAGFFLAGDIDVRQFGTLSGSALLLAGIIVMTLSHRPGGDQRTP
ncbi:hypothetical protein [Streptomyces sp. NPDC093109]|uniref:hypothetical protein n=1 Tax=Streptomyces sp. NPDC093109 TaxID=3154977 RepID=UPI00344C73DC